jgi:predicted alpha/beta-hydrolase family hydrolase
LQPGRPLPAVGETVALELDWPRRYALMRLHTALHVMSCVVVAPVTGGNIAPDKARLDFDIDMSLLDAARIERETNALIARGVETETVWITDDELDARPELVKTMSVQPPRGGGTRSPAAHTRGSTCSPAAARMCATSPRSGRFACSRFAARAGATGASRLRSQADVNANAEPVTIAVSSKERVSGLLLAPPGARACYVLAHGAGAGMTHPFLAAMAHELAVRNIATFRYQFPYMEKGSKRPDSPKVAHATVRVAVAAGVAAGARTAALRRRQVVWRPHDVGRAGRIPVAGGPRPGVSGISAASRRQPSDERGAHLSAVQIPMLFLQGTRDELADLQLMQALAGRLGARATLKLFADADHSFHVPARTGRKDADVRAEMADALANWIETTIEPRATGSSPSRG